MNLKKFMVEFFKEKDRVTVNARELQKVLIDKTKIEYENENLKEQVKTLRLLLETSKSITHVNLIV